MTKLRIIGFNRIGFCFSTRDLIMPAMIPKAGIGIQAITEIAIYLVRYENLQVPAGTLRHILRRNRDKLNASCKPRRKGKREFVDWYTAKPFEIVQSDVNSRFKLIAYSRERSWTNGLCFYLWVISWLRSHGVTAEIVFTVDNGQELGGKSSLKIREPAQTDLRLRLPFDPEPQRLPRRKCPSRPLPSHRR
jgi:hypothetical protein